MKTRITLYLLILLLAACEKKEAETSKDILQSHTWRLHAVVIDGEEVNLKPCNLDDFIVFNPDGTGREDYGDLKCEVGQAPFISFTWSMSADQKRVYVSSPNVNLTYDIIVINHSELKFHYLSGETLIELHLLPK